MKNFLWILLLPIFSFPAKASLVREAQLESVCVGEVPVTVFHGMGAALDFTGTDYVAQRAWLGDLSQVTFDTDVPLEQGPAKIIYLRSIERLSFEGLPSTPTTILTLRLSNSEGERLCQMPIAYSSGEPDYTALRIVESNELEDETTATSLLARLDINHVENGTNYYAQTLGEDSPVVVRVRKFINEVRAGKVQRVVARELDIEWALLENLENQGAAVPASYQDAVSL